MKTYHWILTGIVLLSSFACGEKKDIDGGSYNGGINRGGNNDLSWLIPKNEVVDGGPGKDGIPALENPEFAPVSQIDFLDEDDLVIGFKSGDDVRAYAHAILDWHEIVNDQVGNVSIALTYCPLTGTAIGWDRKIDGVATTFGVSGLLYNANLIPYDRSTDSNWSQMKLLCVNGSLKETKVKTYQVVETSWKTWKQMFPDSRVLTTNTGYSRNYSRYPYGDYKTNNDRFLFSVNPKDDRLPSKERVLGVIIDGRAKVYRIESFRKAPRVIHDVFADKNLVIIGDKARNFMVAFENDVDGQNITFRPSEPDEQGVLIDSGGGAWNIFGEALSGKFQGKKLKNVDSFIGYWFSWGAFYPGVQIFGS